ncbi:hypothetical protein EDM34_14200, partial [Staphylococcus aureus]
GSNNNVVPPNSPKNGTNASNKNEAKDSKEPLPATQIQIQRVIPTQKVIQIAIPSQVLTIM